MQLKLSALNTNWFNCNLMAHIWRTFNFSNRIRTGNHNKNIALLQNYTSKTHKSETIQGI